MELGPADVAALDAHDSSEILILSIVTLPPTAELPATANLKAPLGFNLRTGIARQVVLEDPRLRVRVPLEPTSVAA